MPRETFRIEDLARQTGSPNTVRVLQLVKEHPDFPQYVNNFDKKSKRARGLTEELEVRIGMDLVNGQDHIPPLPIEIRAAASLYKLHHPKKK